MIRRLRNAFGASVSDEEVDALVEAGMADVLAALDNVIDDETVLGRIYARCGQDKPAAPETRDSGGAAAAVCARIGMLETAIAAAIKPSAAPSLLGTEYMTSARRFLFELRNGLQTRRLPEKDAFRLLGNAGHALREADRVLRTQHGMSLQEAVLAQIGDLRQLNSDLLGQLEAVTEKVMMLFGHSGDAAPVLIPQH